MWRFSLDREDTVRPHVDATYMNFESISIIGTYSLILLLFHYANEQN